MAIQFDGKKLNGKKLDKEEEAIDILLKDKPDDYKVRILQYVRAAKVDANDPTFVLMVALGNLDIALVDLPKVIAKGGKDLREEINKIITDFKEICQKAEQAFQTQNAAVQAALTAVEKKISAIEIAAQKLQTQIKAVEDAETRIKEKADNLTLAMKITTKELANAFKRIEDRDLAKIWEFEKWRSHHWILATSAFLIVLVMQFDSWRIHSELNQVTTDLRSATEKISDISEKLGYVIVKVGRVEKYLGTKPKK
jgi:septation ring formation regulator EzrA